MAKHETPLLDQLESGPWPSFVTDIKRQAEMTIHNEIMDARRTLKNEVADQAAIMAEELIVKNLTPEDQVKIIEDYLDKVGAVQ